MEITKIRQYQKRMDQFVVAVQLDLETDGFTYEKWGETQRCKPRDWIVNNNGEAYTVDAVTFAATYGEGASKGQFVKMGTVWARIALAAGSVRTKEGRSHYVAGDYIVSNNEDGSDSYCMKDDKFLGMYERTGRPADDEYPEPLGDTA